MLCIEASCRREAEESTKKKQNDDKAEPAMMEAVDFVEMSEE